MDPIDIDPTPSGAGVRKKTVAASRSCRHCTPPPEDEFSCSWCGRSLLRERLKRLRDSMRDRTRRGADPVALRKATVDLMLAALTDPIDSVQNQATTHLRKLCATPSDAASLLAEVMRDAPERVRWRAVRALGLLVPDRIEELPLYLSALEDGDPRVCTWGQKELRAVGPHPEVLSGLLARLQGDSRRFRCRAAEALGELGSASDAVIDALAGALTDPDGAVRAAAVTALRELGRDARDAIPALLVTITDSNSHVRGCAIQAVYRLAERTDVSLAFKRLVRWSGVIVCLARGLQPGVALYDPALAVHPEGRVVDFRDEIDVLDRLPRELQDMTPEACRERLDLARLRALAVLSALQLRAPRAASALLEMLRHRGGPAAARTPPGPGDLENRSGPAVAPDAWILVFATAWQGLGPEAASAVPRLEAIGEHGNAFVRGVVAETLALLRGAPSDPRGQDPAG
jgi:HEAT repeat protein